MCILSAGSKINEEISYIINCGMENTVDEDQLLTEQCSEFHKGARVWGIYGASHGLVTDVFEAVIQSAGIRTNQVKVAEKAITLHKGSKLDQGILRVWMLGQSRPSKVGLPKNN